MLYDEVDASLVESRTWFVQKAPNTFYVVGYPVLNKVKKCLMFHRASTECPSDLVVDHIDGNGLNNTRANLRLCTRSENLRNIHKNTVKGVGWYSRDSKWHAQICFNNKRIFIGYFENKLDAAIAYNNKAKELFGDFANLNIIGD